MITIDGVQGKGGGTIIENITRIIIGGDVMLGRLVNQSMQQHGYKAPLQLISPIMRRGDITLVNLECAITNSQKKWHGQAKAFYFGANTNAVETLTNSGVNFLSLANNHILDFDRQGLIDTIDLLKEKNILFAGAGNDIKKALAPITITRHSIKFGMVAFCDHQHDFSATDSQSGIAYIDLNDADHALQIFQERLEVMKKINVDWPILSIHWGPNMVDRPSNHFKELAHQIIDLGYKMIFGHSAHVFHGIEIYHGNPILYSAGDLVDDYVIDPLLRNDRQLIFEVELVDGKTKRVFLYPTCIKHCQAKPADRTEFSAIKNRAIELNGEMGTIVKPYDENKLVIDV